MSLLQQLYNSYNEFHQGKITTNRFLAEDFHEAFLALASPYKVDEQGKSVEGRPIYSVTLGKGPIKVLAWSQMHGNESTATRAILDVLSFFNTESAWSKEADNILDKLTICLVPILNPDGTNKFQRRNALDIDLNRDARANVAPESKILVSLVEHFKADYAFNLHDQRRFYNIADSSKPSTISFLAPAYDKDEGTNESRGNAMKLIAELRNELESIIPGQIGIYSDTFSSRAFGDYVQASGASTILVESGWQNADMEKESVRQLNFCLLISAFSSIANNNLNFSTDDYWRIPLNGERLYDLLLKNVALKRGGSEHRVDIGISRQEVSKDNTSYYSIGEIKDIGDLRGWFGFEELDARGLEVSPGLVWPQQFESVEDLIPGKAAEMVAEGYLYAKVQQKCAERSIISPINLIDNNFTPDSQPIYEGKANFLLRTSEGVLKYIICNGFLIKAGDPIPTGLNGICLS